MRTTVLYSVPYKLLAALAVIAMMLAALPAMPAHAASITVTTTVDELTTDGLCSLREAILNANNNASAGHPDCTGGTGADTIVLTGGQTYTLSLVAPDNTGGDIDITDPAGLTIQTSSGTATIDAGDIDRVLDVSAASGNLTLNNIVVTNGTATTPTTGGGISFGSAATLTLSNSTVSNNMATSAAGCGGGIFSNTAATLIITNSTISGNSCAQPGADGAGLFKGSGGTLTITGSTFANNSTNDDGGALELAAGTVTITNSTFASNIAGNRGGAIHVGGATVTIDFSTFSANTANGAGNNGGGAIQASTGSAALSRSILANSTAGMDCNQSQTGTVTFTDALVEQNTTCSGTFITSDPGLGGLASNGGPTQTMAITSSSPAYNAADTCAVTTDQRGTTRPQGVACDLGAFEADAPPVVLSAVRASANPTSAASVDYTVTFSEPVTGIQSSDFSLNTTLSDATIGGVVPPVGPSAVYTVSVNTGTGNGTIKLVVHSLATATDATGNNLAGLPFTNGEVYEKYQVAPGPATLNTPSGSIGTNFIPTYTWNRVPDTTWYYLWINNPSGQTYFTRWYQAADICGASTCSVTAPKSLQSIGTHTWWVQTWNEAGYGQWSNGKTFTTTTPTAPGPATLVSPTGAIGDTTPTYTWNKLNGATWYYLWVNGPSGAILQQWYDAAEVCGASTCSVTPAGALGAGNYTWWLQTWNPAGSGPWSNGTSFSLALPGAATLNTPSGAISDTTPTYTWNKVSGATWYYLWVERPSGDPITVWYQVGDPALTCNASTCSVTPDGVTLTSGAHTWWIQTYNDVGFGPWSNGKPFSLP